MYFSKAIVVLSVALSALASPHVLRGSHHHELAQRAALPVAVPEPVVIPPKKHLKRGDSARCRSRASSTLAPTTTAIIPPKNVESTPTSSATPETTAAPTTHHTTSKAAPTTSASSGGSSGGSGNDPLGILEDPHSGDGTYYGTGLGSCGITNNDNDKIVALSHILYDAYPGYNGLNPNNNPLCKRMIRATYQGKSVDVMAVDRCQGCKIWDLDFSPSAFNELADPAIGRLHGVTWTWL